MYRADDRRAGASAPLPPRRRYAPSPLESRHVPPSGEVSPDGRRAWPQPSMTAKVLTFGGIGLAAAAATAAAVLAVRAVVDGVAGDDDDKARRAPPRRPAAAPARQFGPSPEAAARLAASSQPGPAPMRRPAPRPASLASDVNRSVGSVAANVRDMLGSVTAAIAAFRGVASQAGGILEEFRGAADQMRGFLDTGAGTSAPAAARTEPPRDPRSRPLRRDVVDLRDPAMPDADETRRHRL